MHCPECGQPIRTHAQFCNACGTPFAHAVIKSDTALLAAAIYGGLVGTVHNLQQDAIPTRQAVIQKSRHPHSSRETQSINRWRFMLLQYDSSGMRIGMVAVEMSGILPEEGLHEGERIEVFGHVHDDYVEVQRLENLTTGITINARMRSRLSSWIYALGIALGCLVLGLLFYLIYW